MFDGLGFADRVNEQMVLGGYTVQMLAEAMDVSPSTIYNLRRCRYKQPDTPTFFSLIEVFNCSADYMLGLVDFPFEPTVYYPPLRAYGTRLKALLKEQGKTQQRFIEDMKISSNLAHKWFSDKTLPGIDYLIRIAEYFDISVDALIGRIK